MTATIATPRTLQIHTDDNVAVALRPLSAGTAVTVGDQLVALSADIPAGHKFALKQLPAGAPVIKYGNPIGSTTVAVDVGGHLHTHNVRTNLSGKLRYRFTAPHPAPEPVVSQRTFDGYRRDDGTVGIRNELWIIPTVGCVNKTTDRIVSAATRRFGFEGHDGIIAYPHPYGCSQLGSDQVVTQKFLSGLVKHPNAGGVLVLGLGCENNNISVFKEMLGDFDPARIRFLDAQAEGDEIENALELIEDLLTVMAEDHREPVSVSELIVGLKCGGSDGFSGITANPLIGVLSDKLVAEGGRSVLTEVPEMFGAEHLLMERCVSKKVFDRTVDLVNDFKAYFESHNQVVYENPSPGNKAGGITTLEDKSLGCTQKGGTCPVVDVLDYGDQVTTPGLSLLNGPGNDMVAITGLAASGAHLVLFSTGRGNPLGGPVPTVKMSSNSDLARAKPHWIDFDAGRLLEDASLSLDAFGDELLAYIIDLASGHCTTRNEDYGYHEIAIFKDGVTL